jgi:hypothetical protein
LSLQRLKNDEHVRPGHHCLDWRVTSASQTP